MRARVPFVSLVGAVVLALCAGVVQSQTKPNFVILFVDDLGMNQVVMPGAPYGYSGDNGTIATPNIFQFAQEGIVFSTWYSSFHVCSPSRASMMTGRYSIRSGIGMPNSMYAPNAPGVSSGNNMVLTSEAIGGLPLNETTIPQLLKTVGYATKAIGKWHLGCKEEFLPTNRGFDEYLGIPFSQDMGISFWRTDNYVPSPPFAAAPLPLLNHTTIVQQPVALDSLVSLYVKSAGEFIHRQAKNKTPFFLYMSFNHVHAPNSCAPDFCGKSKRGPVGDAVEEMDWAVGQIMQAISAAGVDDNTLVFFTSDNGSPLSNDNLGNLPLRDGKSSTWEGGFREPGAIRWPGKIQGGRVSDEIVSTMDIFPTVLTLAGANIPADRTIDGIDLSPILFTDSGKGHDCYMFYHAAAAVNASKELFAVRCGVYKLYWATFSSVAQPYPDGPHNPPLLFNLDEDPGESKPIPSTSAEYQQAAQTITQAKEAHLKTITIVPNQNGMGSSDKNKFCSDPNSKKKYPEWPACTINPENWIPVSTCSSAACLAANPTFNATCHTHPQTV